MNILLTNDDGPFGPGLGELAAALGSLGEVTIVCPAEEHSGVGHAITFLVPVRNGGVRLAEVTDVMTLTGTPADCVKFGLAHVFGGPPDLVVAGPNPGVNTGVDVFYSGTVAAAMEGGFNGVCSAAVSTSRANGERPADVARQAVRVIRMLVDRDLGRPWVFNINVPPLGAGEPEVAFTRQSLKFPRGTYTTGLGPRDRRHYWLDSAPHAEPPPADSDVACVERGAVSVTPLRLDLTDLDMLADLSAENEAVCRESQR